MAIRIGGGDGWSTLGYALGRNARSPELRARDDEAYELNKQAALQEVEALKLQNQLTQEKLAEFQTQKEYRSAAQQFGQLQGDAMMLEQSGVEVPIVLPGAVSPMKLRVGVDFMNLMNAENKALLGKLAPEDQQRFLAELDEAQAERRMEAEWGRVEQFTGNVINAATEGMGLPPQVAEMAQQVVEEGRALQRPAAEVMEDVRKLVQHGQRDYRTQVATATIGQALQAALAPGDGGNPKNREAADVIQQMQLEAFSGGLDVEELEMVAETAQALVGGAGPAAMRLIQGREQAMRRVRELEAELELSRSGRARTEAPLGEGTAQVVEPVTLDAIPHEKLQAAAEALRGVTSQEQYDAVLAQFGLEGLSPEDAYRLGQMLAPNPEKPEEPRRTRFPRPDPSAVRGRTRGIGRP